MNYDAEGNPLPDKQTIRISASVHYYGDTVRALFIAAAVLMFLERFFLANPPFSDAATIASVVILVIAAGVTNPTQMWIQWVNVLIAAAGFIAFALFAIQAYHAKLLLDSAVAATLTLVFMVGLYFATRTVRGLIVGSKLPIR